MARFLQKLELQGFKSFAHKTTIEFREGVTIVVGPNGCGKSNVLDGIRWVLGETSARALRGGRMGDVVFRGAAGTRAAGLAQVILTVDNTARSLPLDQSEVQVMRRLFNTGDSEYHINKQLARMRDIQDLFLNTGFGADGYSIIEQGRVGEMVTAKPDQRREIFEEAAGISRYKARREETMRKLVRTEEDLIRLSDIVGEVEKTANALSRQAKRAERHRRIVRRLGRAQRRLLLLRHRAYSERRVELDRRHEAARVAFEGAATRLAQAEAQQSEAARLIEALNRELSVMQEESYRRQSAIEREQHQIALAEQRARAAQERRDLLDRELRSAESRASILRQTLGALEEDIRRETEAVDSTQRLLAEEQTALDALRAEVEARSKEIAGLRAELATLRAKESALLNDRRVSDTLMQRLMAENAQQAQALEDLRRHAGEDEAVLESARSTVDRLQGELKALHERRAALMREIQEREGSRGLLTSGLEETTRALNHAASRLQALQELEDSFEGYFRGVKETLVASQKKRLKGIVGVVSTLLRVPTELDLAIEVALGGDMQDIVTETVADAKAAIEYLKRENLGRATYLPLDFLHADQRDGVAANAVGRRGVLGFARNLITFDAKIDLAVRYLFGNTLIVEKLDVAIDLEREGIRTRYVSLQGDLVNPRGVLSGGSHQSRGLLSRSREIGELQDRKRGLEGELEKRRVELQAARDTLGAMHAEAAALQAKVHEVQMAEARAEKDLVAAETRRRERRNSLAVSESRAAQQSADMRKHQERIAACDAGLGELTGKLEALEARLAESDVYDPARQARMSAAAEAVAARRAELSGRRERLRSFESKVRELSTEEARAGGDQDGRRREIEALEAEVATAIEDRAEREGRVSKLAQERADLEAKLGAARQDFEVRGRSARALVSASQSLLRERNEADNALREVDLALAEVRTNIENVEREASEEFGLTIEEVEAQLQAAEETSPAEALVPESEDEAAADRADLEADDLISDPTELRRLVNDLRERIAKIGPVNEAAIEEYAEARQRLEFLTTQKNDLIAAKDSLRATIDSIDETTAKLFHEAFERIRGHFVELFRRLFNGGKGDLLLVPQEGRPEPGIDIFAQPPGKNIGGSIMLMSGGEKALTAVALMLALFKFKPSPVCILDEIDAPLDDVNVGRFTDVVREFSRETQFIVITHNKITMALADTIYGVTMQEPGVSRVVSVAFDRAEEAGLLDKPAGVGA